MLSVPRYTSKKPIENTKNEPRDNEVLDTEPQDNPELDDEDDLFAGYHDRPGLTTPKGDNWFSQGTIDYKKGDVKAFWLSRL